MGLRQGFLPSGGLHSGNAVSAYGSRVGESLHCAPGLGIEDDQARRVEGVQHPSVETEGKRGERG